MRGSVRSPTADVAPGQKPPLHPAPVIAFPARSPPVAVRLHGCFCPQSTSFVVASSPRRLGDRRQEHCSVPTAPKRRLVTSDSGASPASPPSPRSSPHLALLRPQAPRRRVSVPAGRPSPCR